MLQVRTILVLAQLNRQGKSVHCESMEATLKLPMVPVSMIMLMGCADGILSDQQRPEHCANCDRLERKVSDLERDQKESIRLGVSFIDGLVTCDSLWAQLRQAEGNFIVSLTNSMVAYLGPGDVEYLKTVDVAEKALQEFRIVVRRADKDLERFPESVGEKLRQVIAQHKDSFKNYEARLEEARTTLPSKRPPFPVAAGQPGATPRAVDQPSLPPRDALPMASKTSAAQRLKALEGKNLVIYAEEGEILIIVSPAHLTDSCPLAVESKKKATRRVVVTVKNGQLIGPDGHYEKVTGLCSQCVPN